MSRASPEPVAIAIMAKAPVAGQVKTRLAAELGAAGAAALQARLIERAVATSVAAATGPVTLWVSPDEGHPLFGAIAARFSVARARQPDGDLGARMLAAMTAANAPAMVIGTDCPALAADDLRSAADILRAGMDVVAIPAADGGYVLIGTRSPQPALFAGMPWGSETVMAETRRRLARLGLAWREPARLWDLDRPEDLPRLRAAGLSALLAP